MGYMPGIAKSAIIKADPLKPQNDENEIQEDEPQQFCIKIKLNFLQSRKKCEAQIGFTMDHRSHFVMSYPKGQVFYLNQTCNYTAKLTPTSEICALLDKKNGTISYQVDGKYKGIAFTNKDLCHSDVYFYVSLDKGTVKDSIKIINPGEDEEADSEEEILSQNED